MTVRAPERHFPSAYAPPSMPPVQACHIPTQDGALIATFIYEPDEGVASDTPVLMLHGNGEEHGIFGTVIDEVLEAGHRVVALDSRAQGKSTRGSKHLTYELMAEDAISVLDALTINTAHILGFSDGAIEGLILARDYPERVLSATLLGANLTPEGVLDSGWNMEETAEIHEKWATWAESSPCGIDPLLLTPTPQEATITAELLRLMLEEPHIKATSLEAITCPVTVMVGEFDCIRDDETVAIAQAIPNARLVVVPGAGHTLPKHAPAAVSHELLKTIRQV